MASPVNAVICALLAAAFWTVLGYALARHLLPRVLALGAAPVVGWAVFSAATLPVLTLFGFSSPAVIVVGLIGLVIGAVALLLPSADADAGAALTIPPWSYAGAAVLALVPASAIVPKFSATRRASRRADLRSCQNRDHRCDDAAGLAAGQSGVWRIRHGGPARLLLPLALQRRGARAAAARQRLGSRYRLDLVHRLRLARADDGHRGVAQQATGRGDSWSSFSPPQPRCV